MSLLSPAAPNFGLLLLLGLRHGLDPDHVAVIDNLTFRAMEDRPRWAGYVGAFFAIGHSLSVAVVALAVSLLAAQLAWPRQAAELVDWATIGLLVMVGVQNLRGLMDASPYVPAGWRQSLLPSGLRRTSHPLGVIAIGALFGLVFDTATQAAAWGLAASARGGVIAVLGVSLAFAIGMTMTDTADSQIVARLLRRGGDAVGVRHYRRRVGWLIVVLSFGMAAYAFAIQLAALAEAPDAWFTLCGAVMAAGVVGLLVLGNVKPSRIYGTHEEA